MMKPSAVATEHGQSVLLQDPFDQVLAIRQYQDFEVEHAEEDNESRVVRINATREQWTDIELRAKALNISLNRMLAYTLSAASTLVPGEVLPLPPTVEATEGGHEE